MNNYKEEGICCICGRTYTHWGNNADPVKNGRCCDICNNLYVIPARIDEIQNRKNKEEK